MTSISVSKAAVRVDAWLWAIRVYKTRSAATAACRAGHVRMGDRQLKAAQIVVPGDRLRVRQPGFERILEVQYVISKRVGPEAAARCFIDHTPPRPKEYIPQIPVRDRGTGRPTKKDRREMERLRDGFPSGPPA